MAPLWLFWVASSPTTKLLSRANTPPSSASGVAAYLAAQWRNPRDILSVLLLIGPEVVKCAIAQLAGRTMTPVAFSFGWVAYASATLLSSFGDGRLMPDSESMLTVINVNSGHSRLTKNWVLGRLWRDLNDNIDKGLKDEAPHISAEQGDLQEQAASTYSRKESMQKEKRPFEGLRITVYEVEENTPEKPITHGIPSLDFVWYMGIAVIVMQLGIAAIPWGIHGQWDTFMITVVGNLLAVGTASLPQWRSEKWAAPKQGGQTVAITEGNGSRSVIVILGKKGVGLHLEVMARGTRTAPAFLSTKIWNSVLALLWVMLLVTVAGMEQNTWYLLAIGILGSFQNLIAASIPRSPAAMGLHLRKRPVSIKGFRVAEVLKEAEERFPLLGSALLEVFFPGSL
ncbi:unnamed protein product, partial [Fusarium fujikuroi]